MMRRSTMCATAGLPSSAKRVPGAHCWTIQQCHPGMRSRRPRRGFGVVSVIAAFAIATTVCAVWTKVCLDQHRSQRLDEERVQAAWLADAGVRRGAARLAADPQYDGEAWQIDAADLGRPAAAAVVIRIEPSDGPLGKFRIVARAAYPRDKPRIAVTKTVSFTPPLPEPTP